MRLAKYTVKRLLRAMDLDVRRIVSEDQTLRHFAGADPVTFQYLSDLRFRPAQEIATAEAIAGIMGFACGPGAAHPLAAAFAAARRENEDWRSREAIRAALAAYYDLVTPSSALEVVGLTCKEAPGLSGVPLHSWVFPWSERSIEETAAHRRICLEEEGLARGSSVTLNDGTTLYGPVSERKLALETDRIAAIANSFAARGFKRDSTNPVEVMGLRAGGAYRWLIVQGQHRLAACSAFGIGIVQARIIRVIRREDATQWPHVVLGTYTVDGAMSCFDRLFAAHSTPSADTWLELWSRSYSLVARDNDQGCPVSISAS